MRIPLICVMTLSLSVIAVAQNHRIDRYVIASGGGHSESGSYQMDGTLGQPIVGYSESDNYAVSAGFWVGFGQPPGGDCVYAPGDVDHNGTPLELSDVVTMIGNYRGTADPSYTCDCGVDPPGPNYAATADPSGNCIPLELNDVVTEIAAYRGSAGASGCPDCPGSLRLLPGSDSPLTVMPRLKAKTTVTEKLISE